MTLLVYPGDILIRAIAVVVVFTLVRANALLIREEGAA